METIAERERLVERDPANGPAWGDLARAYQDAGAHDLARTVFEQAVRLCPEEPRLWFGLGRARLATDDVPGGLAAARRAAELDPDLPEARLLLARALGRSGFVRQAILHLEQALRLDPRWLPPLSDLGWARMAVGEYAAAGEAFEAALQIDPDQPALWSPLGRCLLEQGRPANAVRALETAVFLQPDDGVAWARLGCACFETGRHAEAASAFARGVEHGSDEPWVWYWAGRNAAVLSDGEGLEKARRELKERDAELLRELEARVAALSAPPPSAIPEEGPCRSPSGPTAA
jgi:tetratricopeptide (TPR) repeat protein